MYNYIRYKIFISAFMWIVFADAFIGQIFAGQALVRDMKTHFMAFATILIHNTHGSWIWLAKCMHERNDISLSENLILRKF